ncbi:MAG: hypothetical protein NC089_06950 [Bacteroides sp.]|nr:hypothetical protein [Bacteroides sp.]MCM1548413.1 hypothetical protein [Clostridium sp.]
MKTKENNRDEDIIFEKLLEPKEKLVYYEALMNRNSSGVLEGIREINSKIQNMDDYKELTCTEVQHSGLKGLFQKLIKRSLDWYMEPILQQQSSYNREVMPAIGRLAELAMDDNMAISEVIMNQGERAGNYHCNLKMAKEKVLEYMLFQLEIDAEECLDLRQLPEDILKTITINSLLGSKAVLIETDKKKLILEKMEEMFVEYAVIDQTAILILSEMIREGEE